MVIYIGFSGGPCFLGDNHIIGVVSATEMHECTPTTFTGVTDNVFQLFECAKQFITNDCPAPANKRARRNESKQNKTRNPNFTDSIWHPSLK